MSKGIYERKRNQTLCFRATPEERVQIEARIRVSGLEKGDYYRQSLLNQRIEIVAGKYQSDRLAVELKWLRKQIAEVKCGEELMEILTYCRTLLEELTNVIKDNP